MYKKIVFPIDLQDLEQISPSLLEAQALVKILGAELRLVSVLPGYSMPIVASYFPADMIQKAMVDAKAALSTLIQDKLDANLSISRKVRVGRPHEEILAEAEAWGADLILIPSRVKATVNHLVGSVAQRVAERAHCSVLVMRAVQAAEPAVTN
ncbi:universal stress protein [Thiofilum flexile]|uniref:universal stress protein n=1 Tax=Thiofilum flexile TaxID=125627 RepID=UPI00037D8748|nr:universal stress protein [Thiofilum flexile]